MGNPPAHDHYLLFVAYYYISYNVQIHKYTHKILVLTIICKTIIKYTNKYVFIFIINCNNLNNLGLLHEVGTSVRPTLFK